MLREKRMEIAELYEKYHDRLLRFALSLAHDSDLADDLVQETFTRAMSNIELLKILPDYKKKSWLFSVLRNYFLDTARKRKFETMMRDDLEPSFSVRFENRIDCINLISGLSDKLKDILFMKYWLGMNSREIGCQLAIPPSTVRYRLRHAISILKKNLIKQEE